jgi:hypothetical protein
MVERRFCIEAPWQSDAPSPLLSVTARIIGPLHCRFFLAPIKTACLTTQDLPGIRQVSAVWTFREGKSWGNSKILSVQRIFR